MRIQLGLVLVCITACHRKADAPPSPPPITQPGGSAAKPVDPPPQDTQTGAPGSTNLTGLAQLMPMLQDEAAHRPQVKVTPERVFTALEQGGLVLISKKQVLARTAEAKYCALAKIEDKGVVGIVVCEYESDAKAKAARDGMNTRLAGKFDAVREQSGPTLLTISNADSRPELRKRITDIFKAL